MIKILLRIFPALFFWGVFIFVIFQVPYPDNIASADSIQLIFFFIPLYLALVLTFNFFLKNILISASISLGLIFLLFLKALDSLNLVTGILTIISVYLLVSYFRKNKRSLTYLTKIPKITSLRRRK